jgi:hypothetical protein
MESGLGQFVGDDVVADHLAPSSLMPFQLSLVIAAHLRIATDRMHGGLRERCFQIVIALLARPTAPRDIARLGDARYHAAVGAENFHVSKARQFSYFIQNSQGDGSILHVPDVVGWLADLEELKRSLFGEANLVPMEPELRVKLRATQRGHISMEVEITPDNVTQHAFRFELDQSYLDPVIESCRRIVIEYPVRGTPDN